MALGNACLNSSRPAASSPGTVPFNKQETRLGVLYMGFQANKIIRFSFQSLSSNLETEVSSSAPCGGPGIKILLS